VPRLNRLDDWTARVIVRTQKGILTVEQNSILHLPGGKRDIEKDRTPLCTAKRELAEETGLPGNRGDFKLRTTRPSRQGKRNKYDIYYWEAHFDADVIERHLKPTGEEGEITHILPYAEVHSRSDFNVAQLSMLRRLKCLGPPTTRLLQRFKVSA